MPDQPPTDTGALLELASALAREAGALLLEGLISRRTAVATKSTATDMVTEMDRAAESLVVDGLRRARPDDAVEAEEGTAHTGTSGVRWLVDPLDGTTNYLYRHPAFSVSIAAEVGGEVVAGVVNDPGRGEMFTAVRGGGAYCNDEPLAVSGAADLAMALVGTGFSYESERRRRQAAVLVEVLPAVRDIRRTGSAAIDLCWVACGRLDAFYEKGLAPWDRAAGSLVASEAGARTGDLDGGPPSGAFVVAASPPLFDPLVALLRSAGAADA